VEAVPDLAPADVGAPDAGVGPADAGPADAGSQGDLGPLMFDAGGGADGGGGEADPGGAQPGCAGAPGASDGASDAAPAALALGLLALLALVRRRRGRARDLALGREAPRALLGVALAGMLGWGAAGRAATPEGSWAVTELQAWTQAGDYAAPVLAPTSQGHTQTGDARGAPTVVFTTSHLDRLLVQRAPGEPPRELVRGRRVGYVPTWSPAGDAVWFRTPGQRSADVPARAVGLDGAWAPAPRNRTPGLWVRVVDDAIWLRESRGERRISPPGDRYCCARLSPDGARVAFLGLASGLYLYDVATGTRVALGHGAHPRFAGDGRRLVFDRGTDDGQRLLTSVLVVVDWGDPSRAPRSHTLTGTPPLAQRPSLSSDGHTIAFDAGGAIWLGRIP